MERWNGLDARRVTRGSPLTSLSASLQLALADTCTDFLAQERRIETLWTQERALVQRLLWKMKLPHFATLMYHKLNQLYRHGRRVESLEGLMLTIAKRDASCASPSTHAIILQLYSSYRLYQKFLETCESCYRTASASLTLTHWMALSLTIIAAASRLYALTAARLAFVTKLLALFASALSAEEIDVLIHTYDVDLQSVLDQAKEVPLLQEIQSVSLPEALPNLSTLKDVGAERVEVGTGFKYMEVKVAGKGKKKRSGASILDVQPAVDAADRLPESVPALEALLVSQHQDSVSTETTKRRKKKKLSSQDAIDDIFSAL